MARRSFDHLGDGACISISHPHLFLREASNDPEHFALVMIRAAWRNVEFSAAAKVYEYQSTKHGERCEHQPAPRPKTMNKGRIKLVPSTGAKSAHAAPAYFKVGCRDSSER